MLDFKNNKINILLATDVVARGIDIDDIELVINYHVPHQPEDYVHRIGRTARAGAKGEAITLVTTHDRFRFDKIERFIEKQVPRINLPQQVAQLAAPVADVPAQNMKRRGNFRRKTPNKKGNHHNNRPKT